MTQQAAPESVAEPTAAHSSAQRTTKWLGIATAVAIVAFAYASFFYAPEDSIQGSVQRIFYVHVASAWIAALAFFVVFAGSIAFLVSRNMRWDAYAGASAEVGLLFTTVVLVTGMLWGKAIWGVFWTWEPRLTSVLVLWLLYLAYVALRAYVPDPSRKARFSAVLGIVAFLDVPIVYLSVKWWRTLHPEQVIITEQGPQLPGMMIVALTVGLVAMTLVYVYFVRLRFNVNDLEQQIKREVAK
ncbi:MAG: cytochrome c biogenesis protein CcsA [Actinobacteria bacterium]|nr:cytochrome c biogenesis protein CcsA [Actinomycetota bacterium]